MTKHVEDFISAHRAGKLSEAVLPVVKAHLANMVGRINTTGLVRDLWPDDMAQTIELRDIRQCMFEVLNREAERILHGYATRGTPYARFGRVMRPWLWHARTAPECQSQGRCPHCGGAL